MLLTRRVEKETRRKQSIEGRISRMGDDESFIEAVGRFVCLESSIWWCSPCCLRRAKMGRTQTLLIVCLRFFASRYASHGIRRRLTLLERLILRPLPIFPRLCLFAHSSLPRLHEEHNSHMQVADKDKGRCLYLGPRPL